MSDLFQTRHIGTDGDAQQSMLSALGAAYAQDFGTVEALVSAAVPDSIRVDASRVSALPTPVSERAALRELRALAARNTVNRSLIGLGYYGTITPAVIKRNVLENPGWYTAYTPYQPEISQGRLEALINFQTMVSDLTGLDTANASMLDEGTAVVEGMLLARRASKAAGATFVVDADTFPQTLALLRNRAEAVGIELVVLDLASTPGDAPELQEAFGLFVQYPGASGRVWDPSAVIAAAKAAGAVVVAAADLLALTQLTSPGELGADVAVGTSQRFGVPMGFGGPHAGYMAVRKGLERQLPGRLVGVSQDAIGRPAYRLTPADPGAAHPPREGDLQHLHRPGAVGGHGRDVRRLPRSGRAPCDRPARAPVRRRGGRGAALGRRRGPVAFVLRHSRGRGGRRGSRGGARP